MRHGPKLASLLLLCAVLLTGCADPEVLTKVVVERPSVPSSLLECAPAPSVPGPDAEDVELALYLIELDAARADCASKLGLVRGLVNEGDTND